MDAGGSGVSWVLCGKRIGLAKEKVILLRRLARRANLLEDSTRREE